MRILAESNILLRLANAGDPQRQPAKSAIDKLILNQDTLCVVPQNYYEFWVVATRPRNVNGLGLPRAQAQAEIARFKKEFFLLDETPALFTEWEKLVALHSIVGKNAHNARLVAAMIVHGITHLLTFNQPDFQRFSNITVFTPAAVMAAP